MGEEVMKPLMLAILILSIPVVMNAQAPPAGRIGLYLDEARLQNEVTGGALTQFDVWVWCQPGENGQICAEFAIDYPTGVVNDDIFLI